MTFVKDKATGDSGALIEGTPGVVAAELTASNIFFIAEALVFQRFFPLVHFWLKSFILKC